MSALPSATPGPRWSRPGSRRTRAPATARATPGVLAAASTLSPLLERHEEPLVGLIVVGVPDRPDLVLGELELGLLDDRRQGDLHHHHRQVPTRAGVRSVAEGAPAGRQRLAG